jgi:hypothetical protein
MDIEHPSPTFPAQPTVGLTLPDSFEPLVSASVFLGAGDNESPPHFRANVLVICTRTVNEMTLDDTAADLRAKTATEYPDARMTPTDHLVISGFDSLTTITAMKPPTIGFEIEQIQTVIYVPTANVRVRDLLQVHASYAADTRDRYASLFLEAIRGLRIT